MKLMVLAALAAVVWGSSARGAEAVLRSPFSTRPRTTNELGEDGLLLAVDPQAVAALCAAHEADRPVRLVDFLLPGGGRVELALRPVRVFAEGAGATIVDEGGARRRLAPTIATFSGHVDGAGGHAFLGVSRTMAHGYLSVGGELYILSSGPSNGSGSAQLTRAGAPNLPLIADTFCATGVRPAVTPLAERPSAASSAGPFVRLADVFVELDHEYRGLFSTDQDAIDYATLLWSASSEIFRRDTGAALRIPDGYMRLWTTVPPWGVISHIAHIANVQAYWTSAANPNRDLPRASVHVLTTPVFGGVAFDTGGLCDWTLGYEISSVYGFFPYPTVHTDANNWDLLVVTHEYGHTFGSPHTFDYVPPIDCLDGSGPDEGTIMGSCHLSQGLENVGMRFHARVQDEIRSYLESGAGCLEWLPIALGDYDYDGTPDADDLAALDACLAQGFHSDGCLETFDFDGDGALTSCDRAVLAALVSGPGGITCLAPGACPCGNDGGCAGCANSTGAGASLTGSGSSSASADDLMLAAAGLPAGQSGVFFMAQGETLLPLGDGLRCAGGRAFRFGVVSTGSGSIALGPGITALSHSSFPRAGRIEAGDSWSFQLWHRDPGGPCGHGSNLSSGYRVTFTP